MGKRIEIDADGSSSRVIPAALGSSVAAAKLVSRSFADIAGSTDYATVNATAQLNWSGANVNNGWYADLPKTGERLLKPMEFYDGTNVLAVYTQIPARGSTNNGNNATGESCDDAVVNGEVQYISFINVMDGKAPSVQLIDMNGDGYYNASDNGAARMKIGAGSHTMVASGDLMYDVSASAKDANPKPYSRFPKKALRPNWRQAQ
jgi:type IV pilus assembly protein PilY1